MANIIFRDQKRRTLFKKYELKRTLYMAMIRDSSVSKNIRFQSVLELNKLPRSSSKVRIRNRCIMTGRGKAVLKQWKLSRISFRELASRGLLAGVRRSSW